uniref:regulating synaptic membrane exocytosis protein 2-like n=1 Tax=Callithrix jacchus TaxID=9483 RepID=UPI00159DAAF3|nr:regulating synaptic membrane exocytosis protein 2-like [Callithrix jacchus]
MNSPSASSLRAAILSCFYSAIFPYSGRSHPHTGCVQTSPSSTPLAGQRGRQLPQLPPKGTLERNNGVKEIEPYEGLYIKEGLFYANSLLGC